MNPAALHEALTELIEKVDSARACLDPLEKRAAELGESLTAVSRHAQRQAELRAGRTPPPLAEEH